MFYKNKDETILVDGESYKNVSSIEKDVWVRSMSGTLNRCSNSRGKYLRFRNAEINVVEEAVSRAPMFCNALKFKGYKNILFVGHFNDGQTHWMLDQFAGRMVDLLPPERHEMQHFPDMNIVAQFIPMLMSQFRYEGDFSIVRPPESKYQGVMHELYTFELMNHTLACSQQYKHGQSSWSLDGEHEKFDAVVFLGVPMTDQEVGFEESQVREIFAPYCTPEFDMVDIYYGAHSPVKWYNGEEKDSKIMVDTAFATRSLWDEEMWKGRPEEYQIMKNMVKVF